MIFLGTKGWKIVQERDMCKIRLGKMALYYTQINIKIDSVLTFFPCRSDRRFLTELLFTRPSRKNISWMKWNRAKCVPNFQSLLISQIYRRKCKTSDWHCAIFSCFSYPPSIFTYVCTIFRRITVDCLLVKTCFFSASSSPKRISVMKGWLWKFQKFDPFCWNESGFLQNDTLWSFYEIWELEWSKKWWYSCGATIKVSYPPMKITMLAISGVHHK